MNSKLPFNEEFSKILYEFTNSIIYYKPKDILDFSYKYFYSLENKIPLSSTFGTQINTELTANPKQTINQKETIYSTNKQNDEDLIKDKNNIISDNDKDNENEIIKKSDSKNITHNNSENGNKSENNELEDSEIQVPIGKDIEELIKKREENEEKEEKEEKNIKDIKERPMSSFSGISGSDSQKQGVKEFIADLFNDSEDIAKEQLKKDLEQK